MAAMLLSRFCYPSCKPNTPANYNYSKPSAATTAGRIQVTSRWSSTSREIITAGQREKDEEEEWRSYLGPERLELLAQLEPWVEEHVLPLLKPVEAAWQPSDLLPDAAALGADGFHAACLELRTRAANVPDTLLVCLVANMVTEEALPTYQSVLNRVEAVRDVTGTDRTAWARWIRGWSAEENRHGDVLNRYMYLSGRFDMREVERTVQRLIQSGMAVHAPASPYHSFIYTAFQERATYIAHGNTARQVGAHGDATLARLCGTVAADEKRHEAAYTRIMGMLFEADPDAAVRALAYMMRRRIDMPTALITDGRLADFYSHFVTIAQLAGTYTISDYRGILEHLIQQWRVEELAAGLSGEGRRARDYVGALPHKIRRMEEKVLERAAQAQKKPTRIPISWIFGPAFVLQQPMMRRRIDMPTALITDGRLADFYSHFVTIAQLAGTYTISDYRGILEHLIQQWRVEELAAGLSGEGRRARDYVGALPHKIRRMEEKVLERAAQAQKKPTRIPISWIFGRSVSVMLP